VIGYYYQSPGSQDIQEIRDSSYIINIIEDPIAGDWNYEINGNLILALDLVGMTLLDPVKAVYFMNSKIPVSVGLSTVEETSGDLEPSDFKISCKIKYPDMSTTEWIVLLDDGQKNDLLEGDGIFNYLFEELSGPGDYPVEFAIEHIPTGSSSLKEMVFTVTDYQPVKKDIFLKIENNIIAGSATKIYANFEDFSEGDFSYTISVPDGTDISGTLLDNGEEKYGDESASDGIYSAILEELEAAGDYMVEVRGDYQSSEGYELFQVQEVIIGKYIWIAEIDEILEIEGKDAILEFKIKMESIYDKDLIIGFDPQKTSGGIIDRVETDSNILEAGTAKDIGVKVYFKDGLEPGEYTISVPFVLGDVYHSDTIIGVLYEESSFMLDLKTLSGLILIFASLIALIFLLYTVISMRKLQINLTNPRMIIAFAIFIVLFITGLIMFFI